MDEGEKEVSIALVLITIFAVIGIGSALIWGPGNAVEKESEEVIQVIVDYEFDEYGKEVKKEESKKD